MRSIKLSGTILAAALFFSACNLLKQNETVDSNPYRSDSGQREVNANLDQYIARENLDLQALGPLLERAQNAEELEYLLNSDNRINNLDLNQDGYADYISVSEFDDENEGERGLSLFSQFGPDLIQEIATIIFDRNGLDSSGARVLLAGNDQLYGDDSYYEANWLDRALPLVSWLFSDRDSNYASPYYYNNYPDYYQTYQIVETPVYQSRIREIYSEPLFIQTTSPTIREIEIRSPYEDRTVIGKDYPKPTKPMKEQTEVRKNNPGPPDFVPVRRGWEKNNAPRNDNGFKEKPNNIERPQNNERVEIRERPNNVRREAPKPQRAERPNFNPPRVERPVFNQPRPNKVGRPNMNHPKQDNPGRGNGGNKPGKGNGGGNPGKGNGGGGKGGGKKN